MHLNFQSLEIEKRKVEVSVTNPTPSLLICSSDSSFLAWFLPSRFCTSQSLFLNHCFKLTHSERFLNVMGSAGARHGISISIHFLPYGMDLCWKTISSVDRKFALFYLSDRLNVNLISLSNTFENQLHFNSFLILSCLDFFINAPQFYSPNIFSLLLIL